MLQHGRSSSNEIILTDVNYLANEYVNLAYHAFKVKDKTFHAVINIALDPTLEKINIIAEDIGRVLMNIYDTVIFFFD